MMEEFFAAKKSKAIPAVISTVLGLLWPTVSVSLPYRIEIVKTVVFMIFSYPMLILWGILSKFNHGNLSIPLFFASFPLLFIFWYFIFCVIIAAFKTLRKILA